jgi:hypothetical protein
VEIPGDALRGLPFVEWFYDSPELVRAVEQLYAAELGLEPGGVFLDYPEKPRMMGLGLLLLQRDGRTVRIEEGGQAGLIDLPRISDQLYHSARVLRVFCMERRQIPEQPLLDLLSLSRLEVEERLRAENRLE